MLLTLFCRTSLQRVSLLDAANSILSHYFDTPKKPQIIHRALFKDSKKDNPVRIVPDPPSYYLLINICVQ